MCMCTGTSRMRARLKLMTMQLPFPAPYLCRSALRVSKITTTQNTRKLTSFFFFLSLSLSLSLFVSLVFLYEVGSRHYFCLVSSSLPYPLNTQSYKSCLPLKLFFLSLNHLSHSSFFTTTIFLI